MKRRQPDAFATAVYGDRPSVSWRDRWRRWQRIGLPLTVGAVVVVAVAVVGDLPHHESIAAQRVAATSLLSEVNTDLNPCTFSINEANTIYRDELAGKLSTVDRGRVPSLLGDDAAACSFTSDNVNDLADIEEPGSGAGKWLSQVVSLSQTWTTSDALGAIDDLISLTDNPRDASARGDLLLRQRLLTSDRHAAMQAMAGASHYLDGGLPPLKIPAVTLPG